MKTIFKILVAVAVIAVLAAAVLAIGHFTGWWHFDKLIGEVKTYEYTAASDLDVNVLVGQITFEPGTSLKVETNHKYVSSTVKDGKLEIKEDGNNIPSSKDIPYIKITIPAGKVFNSVKIKTTAGSIAGGGLTAKTINFDLTGGVLGLESVKATERFIVSQTGGKMEIRKSEFTGADMKLTAGDCEITAAFKGINNINCGSGAMKLALIGSEADYKITFDKSIGSTTYQGASVEDKAEYGAGSNYIRVECATGKTEVVYA